MRRLLPHRTIHPPFAWSLVALLSPETRPLVRLLRDRRGITIGVFFPLFFLLGQPRLIRKRISTIAPGPEESIAERRFHFYSTIVFLIGMAITSYDASSETRRANFLKMYNWTGVGLVAIAMGVIVWVFRINKFAARVVHVQPGQKLVTLGPYAIVRHPMYMAMIPCMAGLPLAIGSFWGLVPMAVSIVLIAIRIVDEEAFLVETFGKEYQDYRKQVHHKMVPLLY